MHDLSFTGLDLPGVSDVRLRHSTRARRMRLEVRPDRSLLIVVPVGMREDQWMGFVLSRSSWIQKSLERMPAAVGLQHVHAVPERIDMICTGRNYRVQLRTGRTNRIRLHGDTVQIDSTGECKNQARQLLRRWLMRQARDELGQRLADHSTVTGLDYGKMTIRGQKTRWGSCSSAGNISLNYKLMFLPSRLVDHVILHELVHTRHLNHSVRFWRLLEKLDPDTRVNRSELRRAGANLPAWLHGI